MSANFTKIPALSAHARTTTSRRAASRSKHPSDDEILGIVTSVARPAPAASDDFVGADRTRRPALAASPNDASVGPSFGSNGNAGQGDSVGTHLQMRLRGSEDPRLQSPESHSAFVISPELAQILDAHPELRAALDTAQQFRAVFSTPAAAQDAKTQLDELDAMFFSARPADHAALAARIHELSPAAFHGLAHALQAHAAKIAAQHADANPNSSATNDGSTIGSGFRDFDVPAKPESADHTTAPIARLVAQNSAADVTAPSTDDFANEKPPVVGASLASPAPTGDLQNSAPTANSASPHFLATRYSPVLSLPAAAGEAEGPLATDSDARRLAQLAFFHSANAAAVRQIVSAIESHVNRLLPESVSSGAKTRIVGEIYRDLSATLGANRQLGKQLRDAFASASVRAPSFADAPVGADFVHRPDAPLAKGGNSIGSGFSLPKVVVGADRSYRPADGQQSIVALLVGRAKQALPFIAKRVINEWTHGVVAANRERLSRHESAAKRVDIAGASPSDGVNRKPISPREVDYKRLSDSDILNL